MRASLVLMVAVAGCGSSSPTPGADMSVVIVDMTVGNDLFRFPAECDVQANTGCSAGQKCTVGTDHGVPRDLCFAISASPVGEGAACTTVTDAATVRTGDNCAPGLICENFPGDGSHCRVPCYVRAQCPANQACVLLTTTATVKATDAGMQALKSCRKPDNCDPVAQNVCTGGTGCWLSPADDVGRVGLCLTNAKMGTLGAACVNQVDCAPGWRCAQFNFCRRYCYFQQPDGGASAGSCPAAEGPCDLFFGSQQYGICGAQ